MKFFNKYIIVKIKNRIKFSKKIEEYQLLALENFLIFRVF